MPEYRYIEVPDAIMLSRLRAAAWCQYYADKHAEWAALAAARWPRWVALGEPLPTLGGPISFDEDRRAWRWNTVEARGLEAFPVEAGDGAIVRIARNPRRGNVANFERWAGRAIAVCADPDIAKANALTNLREKGEVAGAQAAHRARALLGYLRLAPDGRVDSGGAPLARPQQFVVTAGDVVARSSVAGRFDSKMAEIEEQERQQRDPPPEEIARQRAETNALRAERDRLRAAASRGRT